MKTTLALCAAIALAGCSIPYSDGDRTGTVQKISKKGLIWKTYEGELVMDGWRMRSSSNQTAGSASASNVWRFSVADPKVVEQINAAAERGQRVTLTYKQTVLTPPWENSTGYTVTTVKLAPQEKQ